MLRVRLCKVDWPISVIVWWQWNFSIWFTFWIYDWYGCSIFFSSGRCLSGSSSSKLHTRYDYLQSWLTIVWWEWNFFLFDSQIEFTTKGLLSISLSLSLSLAPTASYPAPPPPPSYAPGTIICKIDWPISVIFWWQRKLSIWFTIWISDCNGCSLLL